MRYTLTVGLLVCMPTVVLLAVAGSAVLAGKLHHRLAQAADRRRQLAPGPDLDQLHDEMLSSPTCR
jgi:hypothetical protein